MGSDELLEVHRDPTWLPAGSSAEVWACSTAAGPDPAAIVRLLLTRSAAGRQAEFFCVATAKGLDLPSRLLRVGGSWEPQTDGFAALSRQVVGRVIGAVCVGYVRNAVPFPDDAYSLPTPIAYVPVYRATASAAPIVPGEWVTLEEGRSELQTRHWWRVVERAL